MHDDQQYLARLRKSNENVERLQQQRLEAFLAKQPDFEQEVELEQMRYPYHIIRFKEALKHLDSNQTLKISSKSLALIEDLAACSRILGFPEQYLRHRGRNYLYVTRLNLDFLDVPLPVNPAEKGTVPGLAFCSISSIDNTTVNTIRP